MGGWGTEPGGALYDANYHTHGAFDPLYDNEQFSVVDVNSGLNNYGQPSYLGTAQGRIEVFDPLLYDLFPYGCVAVGAAVQPGPGVSEVPVPKCP